MTGLIEEIQRDALDPKSPISALLRKVKVAATKLNLPPTERWVDRELSGYNNATALPAYRELIGHPRALNPYRGWIPILLGNKELDQMLASCGVRESVASLECIADQLQPHLAALKAAGADGPLLDKSLGTIHKQGTSSNPDQSALRGALTDLRNALSGAAGNLIASGAITMIAKMLGG
jgi:AbiTii